MQYEQKEVKDSKKEDWTHGLKISWVEGLAFSPKSRWVMDTLIGGDQRTNLRLGREKASVVTNDPVWGVI